MNTNAQISGRVRARNPYKSLATAVTLRAMRDVEDKALIGSHDHGGHEVREENVLPWAKKSLLPVMTVRRELREAKQKRKS